MIIEKACPVCGEKIVGRSDKVYCCDHCRRIGNNKKNHDAERPILELNKNLRTNRMILRKLCPVGKNVVRKEVLDLLGYDFTIFSSIFVNKKKQIYYLCHDFGFTPLLDKSVQRVLIICRQPYMCNWDPWRYVTKKQDQAPSSL
jgi:hypothetical protein